METINQQPQDNHIDWKARALALETELAETKSELESLKNLIRLQNHRAFGRSSEKVADGQEPLPLEGFNEAEATADPDAPEPEWEEVKPHKRKKRRRQKDLLKGLPEKVIEHKLADEELACSCCGEQRSVIGKHETRELEVIPAQVWVNVHVEYAYSCKACEKDESTEEPAVVEAQKPKPPLPGSIAAPSMIAHTMDQKYTMGVPLYRQAQQWQRLEIALSRQTLSNWVIKASDLWLDPLWNRMKEFLLEQDIILADETTVQVLQEDGKKATSKSYMWLYQSGRDGPPIVLLEYQPSRSGAHPKEFLQGFSGFLCTDGYAGYNQTDAIRVGCSSHGRRKFIEAIEAAGGEAKAPRAVEGRRFFDQLFHLEQQWADKSPEERHQLRQIHSKPVLEAFSAWLHETKANSQGRSLLRRATEYCLSQWEALNNFLLDGRLEISNNAAERSIKPYVISRKNFLFCNTPNGAQASATTFSLIESAKANGLKPFEYLKHVFTHLPNATSSELDSFLPWSLSLPAHCRMNRE